MLTDYVTTDDVRMVLGVSAKEIKDSVLSLQTLEDHVALDLASVSETLESDYAGASVKVKALVRLFVAHSAATYLLRSLPMFSPQELSDGKASFSRFGNELKDMIDRVMRDYARYRSDLAAALSGSAGATARGLPFAISSPTTDPVTGS